MDASINSENETEPDSDDLTVAVSTLEVEGVRPTVGDHVELKVGGSITKLVNDTAFVSPETINGQPMPDKGTGDVTDEEMMAQAGAADKKNRMSVMTSGSMGY